MVNILKSVVNTLNGVEVKGEDNLDRMLGSIRAIKTVIATLETKPKGEAKANGK